MIDVFVDLFNGLMLTILLVLMIFIGLSGRLLPIWMFLNTMQLIVHTPLLATFMPPKINYFLLQLLAKVRVHSEEASISYELWQRERGLYSYDLVQSEDSMYMSLMSDCGYR